MKPLSFRFVRAVLLALYLLGGGWSTIGGLARHAAEHVLRGLWVAAKLLDAPDAGKARPAASIR